MTFALIFIVFGSYPQVSHLGTFASLQACQEMGASVQRHFHSAYPFRTEWECGRVR